VKLEQVGLVELGFEERVPEVTHRVCDFWGTSWCHRGCRCTPFSSSFFPP
jgi:hypothetical protein